MTRHALASPFICVSSCRHAYLFSLFQYPPPSLSFPPFPFHSRSPSLSILLYLPSLFLLIHVRFIVSLSLHPLLFFLSLFPSSFPPSSFFFFPSLYLSSPSFPFLPLSLTRLRPSTLRQIFPSLPLFTQRVVSLPRARCVNVCTCVNRSQ